MVTGWKSQIRYFLLCKGHPICLVVLNIEYNALWIRFQLTNQQKMFDHHE